MKRIVQDTVRDSVQENSIQENSIQENSIQENSIQENSIQENADEGDSGRGPRVPVRLAVLAAAAGAMAFPFAAPPVQAAQAAPPAGGVELLYADPDFSDSGNRVTWRWTVRNTGTKPVGNVVLTHQLTPRLNISSVSAPCKVRKQTITCDYRALRAGGQERGKLVAQIPPDRSGLVQLKGRVTWRQGTAPAADTAQPDSNAQPGNPTQLGPTQPGNPMQPGNPIRPDVTTQPGTTGSADQPAEGTATGVEPPERDDGPEPRPNLNAVQEGR